MRAKLVIYKIIEVCIVHVSLHMKQKLENFAHSCHKSCWKFEPCGKDNERKYSSNLVLNKAGEYRG